MSDKGMMNNPVVKWIEYRLPIFSFIDHSVGSGYPTPKNLTYWWNYGSLAGVALVIMIITGIMLAMQYTPHVDYAFSTSAPTRRRASCCGYSAWCSCCS